MVSRDGENWSPLVVASYVGSLQMVRLLLDAGADVNARGENVGLFFLLFLFFYLPTVLCHHRRQSFRGVYPPYPRLMLFEGENI